MREIFAEFGDLVFSVVIGYISAIEFLYVVRHLYHYSFNHDANDGVDDGENLSQLQDSMRQQLAIANDKEAVAGTKVMKDGVPYKDGFRLEAQQKLIDQLREQLKDKELSDLRRHELETELATQTKIAEKLCKELAEAEEKYRRQLKQEEEATAKKLLEEQKQREQKERAIKEAEEEARKLIEAEKQRESEQRKRDQEERSRKEAEQKDKERKELEEQARILADMEKRREIEQRQREEAEENARRLKEIEKQNTIKQPKLKEEQARFEAEVTEAKENTRNLLEVEKATEEKQAAEEAAAELAARNLIAIEHHLEEQVVAAEKDTELSEKELQLIDSINKCNVKEEEEGSEHKEAELLRKILEVREQMGEESEEEQLHRIMQRDRDQSGKQKRIEENALLFLDVEKEMAELQSKMLDAVEKKEFSGYLDTVPNSPVVEEPCIKRTFSPLSGGESLHSTVKTQLAQDLDEPYSVRTKPLLFPGVSDDTSSIDPASSQKSSFSTQPSEEITTGTDSQYLPQERQEPDGEDTALTSMQYSDDYLRSLDGIKQRPLVREDGSGRRRAFKKRRSSNSSNSSRESRHSRDEELKMFTSLEEEEMKDTADSEYTPIRYTTEPSLNVKGHHRRHKRSPAKDMRRSDDSLRSSLECLGEETSDPWGEVKPEHYKHTEFWKREKALSIDEETEFEKPASSKEVPYSTAINMPSASSFEEATQKQNQEALTTLQKHSTPKGAQEGESDNQAKATEETAQSDNKNLKASQTAKKETPSAESLPSTVQNLPTINVQSPLDFGPWRDEHGLIMEGLSDFYDFTASINPSRSRSVSRNVSPANTAPNTPLPKNVSFPIKTLNEKVNGKTTIEIYDDTDTETDTDTNYLKNNEFKMENIINFLDSLNDNEATFNERNTDNVTIKQEDGVKYNLQYVADDLPEATGTQANLVPLVNIIDDISVCAVPNLEDNESGDGTMNDSVKCLRSQNAHRSRSRSKSPLPTSDNLKRSVENRRYKMIKHNEDILEKLIESKLLPELSPPKESSCIEMNQATEFNVKEENDNDSSAQSLCVERRRSRSKSPMRLPTAENLSKGLEKRRNKLIERNDEFIKQLEERSQTPESPTPVLEHVYKIASYDDTLNSPTVSIDTPQNIELLLANKKEEEQEEEEERENDDCSREDMNLLVQSMRAARSTTKSKSPMRKPKETDNFIKTLETTKFHRYQHTEDVKTEEQLEIINVPTISIEFSEAETEASISTKVEDKDDDSRNEMDLLVQSLRLARSRSTSKSPMWHMEEEAKASEKTDLTVEYVYEFEKEDQWDVVGKRSRYSRSKSPSRSHSVSPGATAPYRSYTPTRSLSPQSKEYDDFHVMLNLEGSKNRTLSISTEEQESLLLTNRQRQLDEEALEKLRNASEEVELRTLSPLILDTDVVSEQPSPDYLAEMPLTARSKLLRKSPTTPDYDRTLSEEVRDIERIKQEMLIKGFKRSTYVGESMDLGSEFEPLRREAAKFQRSRSPSPSYSTIENATAQRRAQENRQIQDLILQELTTSSTADAKECKNTGAIPKTELEYSSCDEDLLPKYKMDDNECFKENKLENVQELRRRNAKFRRSASASRSPLRESQLDELANIEVEAAKRVLKDKILDEVSCTSLNFKNFSRHLNVDYFDNDRRASDSALIKVPDDVDLEPEEYHHNRRFSLAQEEPVEQYPGDDYIFIQQVEVRTRSGSRTWLREDFYSENVEEYLTKGRQPQESSTEGINAESAGGEEHNCNDQQEEEYIPGADDEEEYSNGSDDDRQTVVEVDDEIDEDISDFNERGPAEESHHETSECEEAEREIDRYANNEASDWNRAVDVGDILVTENHPNEMVNIKDDEGAVGGLSNSPYDSDSFAIDQIYDEAIKNRKQSGILREYDSILRQMSMSSDIDEQYLMWSKINDKTNPKDVEFNTKFLDNERKGSEVRYLGDANITARQSARLRSRYGYNPVLQSKCIEDDLQVDLNYKPKREYNWRKNFKLDEDIVKEDKEITLEEIYYRDENDNNRAEEQQGNELNNNEEKEYTIDVSGFSLGEESLLSRSPERTMGLVTDQYETNETLAKDETKEEKFEKIEKPKKKKTKKKSHKESKASLEETLNKEDEKAYDNKLYCCRTSSIQMDTYSPKRKSRSRRNSKSSLTNEDSFGLLSPRNSVTYNDTVADIMEEFKNVSNESGRPKKMKKRKKTKEITTNVADCVIENKEDLQYNSESLNDIPAVSTFITPGSFSANILSILSPENNVCVTPASIDTVINLSVEELRESYGETTTNSSSTTSSSPSETLSRTSFTTTNQVDIFDILKDANFYPLF